MLRRRLEAFSSSDTRVAYGADGRDRIEHRPTPTRRGARSFKPLRQLREYCARSVACLALAVAATRLHAATEYKFSVTSEGAYDSRQTGRIVLGAECWQLELDLERSDAVRTHDAVIQMRDRRVALNHSTRTWFNLPQGSAVYIHSLFDFNKRYRAAAIDVEVAPLSVSPASERFEPDRLWLAHRPDRGLEPLGITELPCIPIRVGPAAHDLDGPDDHTPRQFIADHVCFRIPRAADSRR